MDSGAPVMLWNCAILSASEDILKLNQICLSPFGCVCDIC